MKISMHKYLKLTLIIVSILGIFALIFIGNIWIQEYFIRLAESTEPCISMGRDNMACLKQPFIGVGAKYMYFSALIFVFISLLLFKSNKKNLILIPSLTVFYIIFSELTIRIFNIPVLYKAMISGRLSIDTTLYLLNKTTAVSAIGTVILLGCVAGVIAFILKRFILGFCCR